MGLWSTLKAMVGTKKVRVPRLSAKETQAEAANGALVLDVRTEAEFRRGHVPGAVNIPLGDLERRIGEVPKDREVVVHCALGSRSAAAASMLAASGHERVKDFSGGFMQWKREGLPVEEPRTD